MRTFGLAVIVVVAVIVSPPLEAGTVCEMTFTMKGWSAFYKTATGTGVIKCDNGQTAKVNVSSKGGGITFGRSKIKDAIGKFTEVDDISELFGSYGTGEAHAGAGKSAKAAVVTKGEISLAIAGKGTGVDVGISFGKFTIEKAK
ncbi:MAG TPA: hypothetical protein VFO89_05755 [Thermoanaerobaculia bacterium]|nr:hypothetical protein [Thermoanaerobaculia bacterium]